MQILGIDTSGKVAAAALYDTEQHCIKAQQTLYTRRTHSQVILPLAERILSDLEMTWQQVEGFAVAVGPAHIPVCASAWLRQRQWHLRWGFPVPVSPRWRVWHGRAWRTWG